MGSRSNTDYAYIAGFLDGDGSLMLQIKKRKDGRLKKRFMCTVCFYQDTRHEHTLLWIRQKLGIGYISRRNDGMTELRVNGFRQTRDILKLLLPYIRFKKLQAKALYSASHLLSTTELRHLTRMQLTRILHYILVIQKENYVTKRKKTKEELSTMLDLTP